MNSADVEEHDKPLPSLQDTADRIQTFLNAKYNQYILLFKL